MPKHLLKQMIRQTGNIQINKETGMIQKGEIVKTSGYCRGMQKIRKAVIKYLLETYPDQILDQHYGINTPVMPQVAEDPLVAIKLQKREYEKVIDYALELGMEEWIYPGKEKQAKKAFMPGI